VLVAAAGWIGSVIVNACEFQRGRIDEDRVTAAMPDQHWIVWSGNIEIVPVNGARSFAVIIEESFDPLARCNVLDALMNGGLNGCDRILVAGDFLQMAYAGVNGVRMRIIESGQDSFPAQINFAGIGRSQTEYFIVGTDREDAAITDGEGLSARKFIIGSPDIAVVQDEIRLNASAWE
jgi:hypothetical protein